MKKTLISTAAVLIAGLLTFGQAAETTKPETTKPPIFVKNDPCGDC